MAELCDLMDIFTIAIPSIKLILQIADEGMAIKVLHEADSASDAWTAPIMDLGKLMCNLPYKAIVPEQDIHSLNILSKVQQLEMELLMHLYRSSADRAFETWCSPSR